MFTGIVEAIGQVAAITPKGADYRITLETGQLDLADVKLGDSIAVNGVCLTVVAQGNHQFSADVSAETLARSGFSEYRRGSRVNLEKALLANGRLGGHLVSGHVDGRGEVRERNELGRATEFWIEAPAALAKYIAEKGSITVDGVSLTVNAVDGARFKLTLIPHTMEQTIMPDYRVGSRVNLEVDVIARYLERLLMGEQAAESQPGLSLETLARAGFVK